MLKIQAAIKRLTPLCKIAVTVSQLQKWHTSPGIQFGGISAYKAYASKTENKERTSDLIRDFGKKGLSFQPTSGFYAEKGQKIQSENFFIVWDIDFNYLIRLARKYDQESVIFKEKNGTLALYEITGKAYVFTDLQFLPNQPKVKEKYKDPKSINPTDAHPELDPHGRIRNTELRYSFDWAHPIQYSGSPVTMDDYLRVVESSK